MLPFYSLFAASKHCRVVPLGLPVGQLLIGFHSVTWLPPPHTGFYATLHKHWVHH